MKNQSFSSFCLVKSFILVCFDVFLFKFVICSAEIVLNRKSDKIKRNLYQELFGVCFSIRKNASGFIGQRNRLRWPLKPLAMSIEAVCIVLHSFHPKMMTDFVAVHIEKNQWLCNWCGSTTENPCAL